MFMIIIFHIPMHCVAVQMNGGNSVIKVSDGALNHPVFYNRVLLLNMLYSLGYVSNGIFIMLSGYFMLSKGKSINLRKISHKLLTQLGFAAVALVIVSVPLFIFVRGRKFLYLPNITIFNGMSWYVGYYYIIILLAALFLNDFLVRLDRDKFADFIIVFFALISFSWTVKILEGLGAELSIVATGVFFYSLGGYIHKYDPFKKVKTWALFLIIFLMYGLVCLSYYNNTQTNIENYNPNGNAAFSQSIINYGNKSIIVIVVAICIFEIFKRIKMPHLAVVNFLGQGTFMVYLMHDNSFFYSIWGFKNWVAVLSERPWRFIIELLMCTVATFIFGISVYVAYIFTMRVFQKSKRLFLKNDS